MVMPEWAREEMRQKARAAMDKLQVAEAVESSRLHVVIFDTLCGIEFGIGAAQVAEAVLASDWLRDRDAAKWEEGVMAKSNSSSIFDRDVLAKNPYRKES